MSTLHQFVAMISAELDEDFGKVGEVLATWYGFTSSGEVLVVPAMAADKDLQALLIRRLWADHDVTCSVFIDEAWVVEAKVGSKKARELNKVPPSEHPDRREVVMISAEDVHGELVFGTRSIIRPKGERARLGPLDTSVTGIGGRFVGLLPRPPAETVH